MRNICKNIISANDNLTTASSAIPANQLVSASFHAYFSDSSAAGTFKLQASNDFSITGEQMGFVPTNWVDIPTQTAAISSGSSALLTIANMTYQWVRAIYTDTAAGVQTAAPIADTGRKQAQTVTAVADVASSLNSKFFLLSSVNLSTKAQKNFYVWYNVSGAGVDPAVAGRTGVEVDITIGDTANTVGGATRSALAALTNDFTITGSNAAAIITNKAFGPVTAAVDGSAATGFTFGSATAGIASNLNNKYFYLNSANDTRAYYVWMNVDSIGTDPAVAGKTAIEVDFASGSSAATIGTAMATAIGAAHSSGDFTTSGSTTVQITNQATGPYTQITDAGLTGFTFAVTGGGSGTVNVNMNALGI